MPPKKKSEKFTVPRSDKPIKLEYTDDTEEEMQQEMERLSKKWDEWARENDPGFVGLLDAEVDDEE